MPARLLLSLLLLAACGERVDSAEGTVAEGTVAEGTLAEGTVAERTVAEEAAGRPPAGAAAVPTADAAPTPALISTGGAPPPVLPADSNHSGGWQHYGAEFSLSPEQALRCEALMADLPAHVDHTVRVKGRVADVCQSQGCWMVLTPEEGGEQMIRVTMRDHAFSVDKGGRGRQADVEGVLVARSLDPEAVAHYEGEAGNAAAVPERLATGGLSYELVASAVRFRNPQ